MEQYDAHNVEFFFEMLLNLGIFCGSNVVFQPYDMIGWHICDNLREGLPWDKFD